MELLYVWVESYGNIRKQGFNFSPNYDFNYDEDTKELKCEERKVKQPKLFGDNISNITAIVGKNGSGKSTVLEMLTKINYYLRSGREYGELNKFSVAILKNGKVEIIKSVKEEKFKEGNDFSCIYYCEDWNRVVKNNLKNISFAKQIREVEQEYWTVEKKETKDIISAALTERVCHQLEFLEFSKEKDINNKFARTFSKFKKIEINFRSFYMNEIKEGIAKIIFKNDKFNDSSEIGFLAKILYLIFEYSLNEYNLMKLLKELEEDDNIESLKEKVKLKKENWNLLESLIKIDTLIVNSRIEEAKTEIKSIFQIYAKELFVFFEIHFKEKSIEGIENNENKFLLDNTKENRIKIKGIAKYYKSIDIKYSKEMSKGEFDTLSIFSNLYKEIIEKYNENVENILILLDEPANSFHPEWQREFISDFVEFSKLFKNKKLQLILTSHSPFVASDLPRENVIMLDTYDEVVKNEKGEIEQEIGNCKVVTDKDIKTFGANIFDLYTEAFFVTSSFGEFAKGKIKKVVEWLKYEEKKDKTGKLTREYKDNIIQSNKEQIEYIIDSIGEPLVKNKLKKMYDEYRKYGKDKKTKIEMALKNLGLSPKEMNKILEAIKND